MCATITMCIEVQNSAYISPCLFSHHLRFIGGIRYDLIDPDGYITGQLVTGCVDQNEPDVQLICVTVCF